MFFVNFCWRRHFGLLFSSMVRKATQLIFLSLFCIALNDAEGTGINGCPGRFLRILHVFVTWNPSTEWENMNHIESLFYSGAFINSLTLILHCHSVSAGPNLDLSWSITVRMKHVPPPSSWWSSCEYDFANMCRQFWNSSHLVGKDVHLWILENDLNGSDLPPLQNSCILFSLWSKAPWKKNDSWEPHIQRNGEKRGVLFWEGRWEQHRVVPQKYIRRSLTAPRKMMVGRLGFVFVGR